MIFEEWWGRNIEGRGSVRIETMGAANVSVIRKLPTEDILELIRSEDTRSIRGLLAHAEMRRRGAWTARAALVVSIIALIFSASSIVLRLAEAPPV
jgi:hypothetical protein